VAFLFLTTRDRNKGNRYKLNALVPYLSPHKAIECIFFIFQTDKTKTAS
jgi:hypothetical protein